MQSEQTQARTYLELAQLRDHARSIDLRAELVQADDDTPLHLLIVRFDDDDRGRERIATITFVPNPDDQLEAIKLLQVYVAYPFDARPELQGEAGLLIARLNSRLPLGSLAIADSGELCYKLVHAYAKFDVLQKAAASELMQLIEFVVGLFAEQLEEVATGERSAADALEELGL